jgi:YjbE family integral membrane protein
VLGEFGQLGALVSVVIIDVVLAGDNAIVVGVAAAGLPPEKRRRVILLGIAGATLLRVLFAYFVARLLMIIGLTLAGGILLLWVVWKMFRETRRMRAARLAALAPEGGPRPRHTSPARVLGLIILADVSMSLDNVLAVAGTARGHFWVLAFGLVLSVALMGIASTYVAKLLDRHHWIAWIGLAIIATVALRMIWDGSAAVLGRVAGVAA